MTPAPDVARIADRRVAPPASDRTTSHSLPPELLADSARRLGWMALIYAAGFVFSHFGRRVLLAANGSSDFAVRASDFLGLVAIALGGAVYLLSRSRIVSTQRLLDVGLVFEVVGALGIAALPIVDHLPQIPNGTFAYVPAECVWIVVFPLVVPNAPMRVLVASLLAASMGPMVGVLAAAFGETIEDPLLFAANFLTTNYVCAVIAYVVARMVHGFNVQLKQLQEIGSYELLERIGEGGMGEVWRARHRLLARPAAIKLIRTDVLGANGRTRESFIRRFEREAQETARLGSTHTIDVYDFGVTQTGDFYYVMELLEGFSLERYVQAFGPMEPARVVYALRQALHSLGEAHARGLVHRDVKPANIFLCRLGPDDDFVKVLDFGLVKHFDASDRTLLTKEGATAGTPAYMAPEIALGREIDGRADLYGLGCVAYYLLTGQPVFTADSDVAVALAHVKDEPVRPSVRSEFDIPPLLDALILDCLAKSPAARPGSAAEMAGRLDGIALADTWTGDRAHAWWELHRVDLSECSGANPAPAQEGGEDSTKERCWPRLDHRPHSPSEVVGS